MKIFLSAVSKEFQSYRQCLGRHLHAVKGQPFEIKTQEDFQQGGFTLLEQLADYIRDCDLVIHLVGDLTGSCPSPEHVRKFCEYLGEALPEPLPDWSYTQWEYRLARRFGKRVLVYRAEGTAPRDCGLPVAQEESAARLQQDHWAAIRASGEAYKKFSGPLALVREVFYDLGLNTEELKANNLPFKSLGTLFKGREAFLECIRRVLGGVEHLGHKRLAAITAAPSAAIHGLGGVGKTRAAVEYAHRYAAEYTALLFVQADSPGALHQNLANLCRPTELDLPEKDATDTGVQEAAVLCWLRQHPGWLLILDNIDCEESACEVERLIGHLPDAGHVLVTSRLSNWSGAVEELALDVLDADAAADFLLERTDGRRRLSPNDPAQALELAMELGHLALALEQAGAYIARHRLSFAQYLVEWRDRHERVLTWFDARLMQYPCSVAVTWLTTFEHLSQPARCLLERLAWFAPDPVPEWLLERGGGPFGSREAGGGESTSDAMDALAELEDYSLVKRAGDAASPVFSVHRLVQDVTRRALREEADHQTLRQSLHWVNTAFEGDSQDVRTWPMLDPLAPHAQAVVQYADAVGIPEPTSRLMNQLGVLYQLKSRYAESESLARRALEIDEQTYGPDHHNIATSLNNLAELLRTTNRLTEAEKLFRRALAITEKTFGPDHPNFASSLNNLAQLLRITNRLDEAEPLYRRALSIFERINGPDHPNVASILSNLSSLFKTTNRLTEAEPLVRRTLAIREASYGPDHPDVAQSLNNLALLLHATSRLAEAEPLYRRALAIDERSYGTVHPNVARDLNNLAGLLQASNRLAEAEPLFRRALASDERSYGPTHPNVANRLNNLAALLYATNRLVEAEPLYRRAVSILEQAYEPDHPDVAIGLNNLGALLYASNRLAEVEPLYRRALAITEQAFGSDYPEVTIRLNNLAELLKTTNREAEAGPLYRRSLVIFLKFLLATGHEHPHGKTTFNNYIVFLQSRGLTQTAIMAKLNEISTEAQGGEVAPPTD